MIIIFLVADPYKPSFPLESWEGGNPTYKLGYNFNRPL